MSQKYTREPNQVSAEYLMIESAQIENFRGFHRTNLSALGRVNIIVGDNGAGKTALMEALFAASAASPDVLLKLRQWRGMSNAMTGFDARIFYEGLWGDLFHQFDLHKVVSVSLRGSQRDTRTVRIFASNEPAILPLTGSSTDAEATISPITFRWTDPFGEPVEVTPQARQDGIAFPPVPRQSRVNSGFLAARAPFYASENASYFSELSKVGKEREFIAAMKSQFSEIESISAESDYGTWMLFVKMNWQQRKLPIHILSDGMNKIAAILVNIAAKQDGVLFVDEIDTGIYFRRHRRFWEQIHDFCKIYNTQVFTSTHSLECLSALLPTMKKHSSTFALIRVHRSSDGVSDATVVSGKDALSLIESGLELRG